MTTNQVLVLRNELAALKASHDDGRISTSAYVFQRDGLLREIASARK